MTKVHTRYCRIVGDVTGDVPQQAWDEEELISLERTNKESKRMLVDTFAERCDSGLDILKSHQFDHLVKEVRRFRTISVLDRSPFEHFNVQVNQAH